MNDTLLIVQTYRKLTGHDIKDVIHLNDTYSNRAYRIYLYESEHMGLFNFLEKKRHYLFIKKRWLTNNTWSDERRLGQYGSKGTTIPLVLFEKLALMKDINNLELVIYMVMENAYYSIPLFAIMTFTKRHYTVFVDQWGNEVIGLPYPLFMKVFADGLH